MVRQVTPRQLELLLDFLEEHQTLALGRVRGREGNALSKRLWKQCADILNADASGLYKSGPEWKIYFNQYESRTKAKLRQIKQGRTRTGGGPALQLALFPLEERLIGIVGGCNSPLPARQNPLDAPSEPTTESSAGHGDGTDDIIIVQQDADLPIISPATRPIVIEHLEVVSDAASYSENAPGIGIRSQEPLRDPNPSTRRRRRRRRSCSPKANKEFETALEFVASTEKTVTL